MAEVGLDLAGWSACAPRGWIGPGWAELGRPTGQSEIKPAEAGLSGLWRRGAELGVNELNLTESGWVALNSAATTLSSAELDFVLNGDVDFEMQTQCFHIFYFTHMATTGSITSNVSPTC